MCPHRPPPAPDALSTERARPGISRPDPGTGAGVCTGRRCRHYRHVKRRATGQRPSSRTRPAYPGGGRTHADGNGPHPGPRLPSTRTRRRVRPAVHGRPAYRQPDRRCFGVGEAVQEGDVPAALHEQIAKERRRVLADRPVGDDDMLVLEDLRSGQWPFAPVLGADRAGHVRLLGLDHRATLPLRWPARVASPGGLGSPREVTPTVLQLTPRTLRDSLAREQHHDVVGLGQRRPFRRRPDHGDPVLA